MLNLKMSLNKKGFAIELFIVLIIGIVLVLFFGGWIYGVNLIESELLNVNTEDATINVTAATQDSFSYYREGIGQLRMIALMILFAFMLGTLIVAYYSPAHPVMLLPYIIIAVVLIIMSVPLSNAYEDLLTNDTIGSTLSSFSVMNHILLNLSTYMVVLTFIGIILSLANIIIGREQ